LLRKWAEIHLQKYRILIFSGPLAYRRGEGRGWEGREKRGGEKGT